MAQRSTYIWQHPDWPLLTYSHGAVADVLARAHHQQGIALGQAQAIGLPAADQVFKDIWIDEAVATAAIEGEKLDLAAVRSSVMRRLGMPTAKVSIRHVDGLVEVMQDATAGFDQPLDIDRLCRWQAALFPGGTSGIRRIAVGQLRRSSVPMQIVSGPVGHEIVHYEALPSTRVAAATKRLLAWFNKTRPSGAGRLQGMDGLARAAIAHLWFETIHPFEDGNGRVGRAVIDLALAQQLRSPMRLISLSRQLMDEREAYYDALHRAQRGNCDVTEWVAWFARQYISAARKSETVMQATLARARYWSSRAGQALNERQRKALQRLLDAGEGGFEGGMSAQKYANLTGASKATATRDLAELRENGWVVISGTGRATRYWVNVPAWRAGHELGVPTGKPAIEARKAKH